MRVSMLGVATLPAALLLAAHASAAVFPCGPATVHQQVAASDADALAKCGPKPANAGKWVCVGTPVNDPATSNDTHQAGQNTRGQEQVNLTFQKITWTWTDSSKSATDDWSAPN